jgi:hypothetical protein
MKVKMIVAETAAELEENINKFLAKRKLDCILHYQVTTSYHFCMIEYWPEDEEDF